MYPSRFLQSVYRALFCSTLSGLFMKMWALSFLRIITEVCRKEVFQSAPMSNHQKNVKEKENRKAKRTTQSQQNQLQNKTYNHKKKKRKNN